MSVMDFVKGSGDYVYIIINKDYEEPEILAVVNTEEDAMKAKTLFSKDYDNVSIAKREISSILNVASAYSINVYVELRKVDGEPDTFIMGKHYKNINIKYYQKLPDDVEKKSLTIKHSYNTEKKLSINEYDHEAVLVIETAVPPPSSMKEFREWVRDNINSFGEIKVQVPYSDSNEREF